MPGVLQEGTLRRRRLERQRRARRRRLLALVTLAAVLALAGVFLVLRGGARPSSGLIRAARHGEHRQRVLARIVPPAPASPAPALPRDGGYGLTRASLQLQPHLPGKLASGMLFDVTSGHVLWERDGTRVLPIASLTKMMTALIVAAHTLPQDPVFITRAAVDFTGSGVGLLPLHKYVSADSLLYGLLLPSGNDAAIALSVHVGGSQNAFIALMNRRARSLGLGCTHFTTVSGVIDQGNHSCAADLAVLAHLVLSSPRLAPIVASAQAVIPFPIKGGKLYLYNNNPLLIDRYPGADGVKTGYTTAAGPCLVAAARRGHSWFGVVLLHSTNTLGQAQALLNAAFAATTPRPPELKLSAGAGARG